MNGSAFGFPAYPQKPSVHPRQVGEALYQMGRAAQDAQNGPQMPPGAAIAPSGMSSPGGSGVGPAAADATAVAGPERYFTPLDRLRNANAAQNRQGLAYSYLSTADKYPPHGFASGEREDVHYFATPEVSHVRGGNSNGSPTGPIDEAAFGLHPVDPDPNPAHKMAVHEALDRLSAGDASRGQQGTANPANEEQLARMGLSPLEIKLLWMSGGARY